MTSPTAQQSISVEVSRASTMRASLVPMVILLYRRLFCTSQCSATPQRHPPSHTSTTHESDAYNCYGIRPSGTAYTRDQPSAFSCSVVRSSVHAPLATKPPALASMVCGLGNTGVSNRERVSVIIIVSSRNKQGLVAHWSFGTFALGSHCASRVQKPFSAIPD